MDELERQLEEARRGAAAAPRAEVASTRGGADPTDRQSAAEQQRALRAAAEAALLRVDDLERQLAQREAQAGQFPARMEDLLAQIDAEARGRGFGGGILAGFGAFWPACARSCAQLSPAHSRCALCRESEPMAWKRSWRASEPPPPSRWRLRRAASQRCRRRWPHCAGLGGPWRPLPRSRRCSCGLQRSRRRRRRAEPGVKRGAAAGACLPREGRSGVVPHTPAAQGRVEDLERALAMEKQKGRSQEAARELASVNGVRDRVALSAAASGAEAEVRALQARQAAPPCSRADAGVPSLSP